MQSQSLDGLLLSVLIHCNAARLERARVRAKRIDLWRRGIAIFCTMIAIALLSQIPFKSDAERIRFVVSSFSAPLVFGWLMKVSMLHCAQLPADEENGRMTRRISDNVACMSASYTTTFTDLLLAILDDESEHALLLADELDAQGWEVIELTMLVREIFA